MAPLMVVADSLVLVTGGGARAAAAQAAISLFSTSSIHQGLSARSKVKGFLLRPVLGLVTRLETGLGLSLIAGPGEKDMAVPWFSRSAWKISRFVCLFPLVPVGWRKGRWWRGFFA